jgi:hypothetical protein
VTQVLAVQVFAARLSSRASKTPLPICGVG